MNSLPEENTWPVWASWCGLDVSGYWVFFENEPTTTEDGRVSSGGKYGGPRVAEVSPDWQSMIYKRGEAVVIVDVAAETAQKLRAIVSDAELTEVWAHANFGSIPSREVLRLSVLKCASGYYQGHTSKAIAVELGLIDGKYRLTKKGKEYMWTAFSGGSNF